MNVEYVGKEDDLQISSNTLLRTKHPDILAFHVANEGISNKRNNAKVFGAKRKAKGVLPGVSDWIILEPRGSYHGLVIELKVKGGRLSESQKWFLEDCKERGYKTCECKSLGHFEELLENYLLYGE